MASSTSSWSERCRAFARFLAIVSPANTDSFERNKSNKLRTSYIYTSGFRFFFNLIEYNVQWGFMKIENIDRDLSTLVGFLIYHPMARTACNLPGILTIFPLLSFIVRPVSRILNAIS